MTSLLTNESVESLPRVPSKSQIRSTYRSRPTLNKNVSPPSTVVASAPTPAKVESTSVSMYALEAIHHAISGQPWADLELIVPYGRGTQSVFASSAILKKACPALVKEINRTGALELDTMEELNPVGGGKSGRRAASITSRPTASRRASSSGLLDSAPGGRPRERAPSTLNRRVADDDFSDAQDSLTGDETDERQHDFPRKRSDREYREDEDEASQRSEQDDEEEEEEEEASSYLAAGERVAKVSGSASTTPLETPASPFGATFSKARLSRFVKFMGKDKNADALDSPPMVAAPSLPLKDDFMMAEGGRVRRYSAGNDLQTKSSESGLSGSRTPTAGGVGGRAPAASRVHVSGCTPGTLQALVFYLYTGQTRFARKPTRRVAAAGESDVSSDEDASDASDDDDEHVPEASGDRHDGSKSLAFPPLLSSRAAYCLGHQLNLPDLQARAFQHLCGLLSARTVLGDLLSPFVDRFPEVQRAHLEYISRHWNAVKARDDFAPIIAKLVKGEYPKANAALLQLFAKFSISV